MSDSHAGALKHGWTRIAQRFGQAEITFFAGHSFDWSSIRAAEGKLVPGTERLRQEFARSAQGLEEIDAGYDAYVLCGLGLAISFPLRLWTHHEQPDWESYRAAVAANIRGTRLAHVLARLRQITQARALVLAGPFQPRAFCKSSPLLDRETALKLRANFVRECEALARAHAARFLSQPDETLAPNGVTTRMTFAAASGDPEREDQRHCNADYGAVAMRHVLEAGLSLRPIPD
jgi:hypothetical protein